MPLLTVKAIKRPMPLLRQRPSSDDDSWSVFNQDDRSAVFLSRDAVGTIRAAATAGLPDERIGLLAGRACEDSGGQYTMVVGAVLAVGAASRPHNVIADLDAIHAVHAEIRARHPISEVVGWWHTHPGYGVFFSAVDKETQATFNAPFMVGVVVDPTIPGVEGIGVFLGPGSDPLALQLPDSRKQYAACRPRPSQDRRLLTVSRRFLLTVGEVAVARIERPVATKRRLQAERRNQEVSP